MLPWFDPTSEYPIHSPERSDGALLIRNVNSPDSSFSLVNRAEILYVVSPLVIFIELLHIECVLLYPASLHKMAGL